MYVGPISDFLDPMVGVVVLVWVEVLFKTNKPPAFVGTPYLAVHPPILKHFSGPPTKRKALPGSLLIGPPPSLTFTSAVGYRGCGHEAQIAEEAVGDGSEVLATNERR